MTQSNKGAVKRYRQVWLWLVLWVAFLPYVQAEGIITTLAENGTAGFSGDGGPATVVQLNNYYGVVVNGSSNLYIADAANHRTRKVTFNNAIANQPSDDMLLGLIGYYPFDGNALDNSGHGNDGVARETVSYANGKFGQAAQFTDGYIEVPNIKDFTFNNQSLTFSVWTTVAHDYKYIYIPFISLGWADGDLIHLLKDRQGINSGKIEMVIQNKAAALSLETGDELLGKYQYDWLHVVGIVDYENHLVKLYLNGQLQGTAELKDNFQVSSKAKLFIGYSVCCTDGKNYYGYQEGLMDDVRIYNRALTDKEIQWLYMGNQPPIAQFTATPNSGVAPLTVALDASASSDADGKIVQYYWTINGQEISLSTNTADFEVTEGSVDNIQVGSNTVTVTRRTFTVVFNANGNYTVGLTVKDNSDAFSSETTHTVVVGEAKQPPIASFTATPLKGPAPLTVALDYSASHDPDGSIVKYDWNVNGQPISVDGEATLQKSITFNNQGSYMIGLMVTDNDSLTGEANQTVTVEPTCTYTLTPTSRNHTAKAETDTVNVTATAANCTWTATSNTDWTTITSSNTGQSNGTVTYSVTANSSPQSRSGTLTIAGQTFTITQAGTEVVLVPDIQIEPTTLTFP